MIIHENGEPWSRDENIGFMICLAIVAVFFIGGPLLLWAVS
jgi:nitrogen fixation-related uncharacterized protein